MQLRILPEVADDIAKSASWYNRRVPGLGIDFAEAVYAYIAEIARTPLIRREIHNAFRRGFLRRFPFAVY